ncbi:hypothetical protein M422DRAFT_775044 [Sphaerobolus stellatus SS14]|nr:hypothetical protein M422DRAFT_775044 [Sphaerobolus stellatus SS14]
MTSRSQIVERYLANASSSSISSSEDASSVFFSSGEEYFPSPAAKPRPMRVKRRSSPYSIPSTRHTCSKSNTTAGTERDDTSTHGGDSKSEHNYASETEVEPNSFSMEQHHAYEREVYQNTFSMPGQLSNDSDVAIGVALLLYLRNTPYYGPPFCPPPFRQYYGETNTPHMNSIPSVSYHHHVNATQFGTPYPYPCPYPYPIPAIEITQPAGDNSGPHTSLHATSARRSQRQQSIQPKTAQETSRKVYMKNAQEAAKLMHSFRLDDVARRDPGRGHRVTPVPGGAILSG